MKVGKGDATGAKNNHSSPHPIGIEARRELVWDLDVVGGLSYAAMQDRLKRDHGIEVSRSTICRDVETMRALSAKRAFGSRFDPVVKVAEYVSRHESIAARAIRATEGVTDPTDVAALLKVAGSAYERAMTLLMDSGLVHRNLGVLRVDDDPRATNRIPTGTELQKLFASIHVDESELVSEAEAAWNSGDWAAAEADGTKVPVGGARRLS